MSQQPNPEDGVLWRAVLIASMLVLAHVLYAVEHPVGRLGMGLLLLAPIVWSAMRIEFVAQAKLQLADRPHRRYKRLRSQVSKFLDEVQRLNWLAVDFQRGASDRNRIHREMDAIEGRLNALVRRIREEAGRAESTESGAVPQTRVR